MSNWGVYMKCPDCHAKSLVIDVRYDPNANETYRRRRCAECGKEFYTIEFEVDSTNENFKELWRRINRSYVQDIYETC